MSLQHLEQLISNSLRLIKGRMRLFKLEYNLAKTSVVPLLLLAIGLLILAGLTWLFALVFITYLVYLATDNLFISLLGVLLLNAVLTAIFAFFLSQFFTNMKFSRTRKYLKSRANKRTQENHYVDNQTAKTTD